MTYYFTWKVVDKIYSGSKLRQLYLALASMLFALSDLV